MYFLGIDPGSGKCGIAILDDNCKLYEHFVVQTKNVDEQIRTLQSKYLFAAIIVGNGTGSEHIASIIKQALPDVRVEKVNEYMTTLKARERYWKLYPPKGLWKLIPTSLRIPPVQYDDIVAMILVECYLKGEG